MPSLQHEANLKNFCEELVKEGYKVIITENYLPDAIAVKDNKIIAIEILMNGTRDLINQKKKKYSKYDELFFRIFKRRADKITNYRLSSNDYYKFQMEQKYNK